MTIPSNSFTALSEKYSFLRLSDASIYIASLCIIHAGYFSASYFFNTGIEFPYFFIPYGIVTVVFWIMQPISIIKKAFLIAGTFLASSIIGIVLVLATMILPGSKEHNYVIYNVCLPAIQKAYEEQTGKSWPPQDGLVDKQGFGKWWYQHSECEDNVYAGKGPVFSENPKGFIPVK